MSRMEEIRPGLHVLSDLVPVDGRVTWLPKSAAGFEPYNEYLYIKDDRALLIDTGVARHGPSILATLREAVDGRQLSIYTTRIELDVIGNLALILSHFPDAQVVTTIPIEPTRLIHMPPGRPLPRPVQTLRYRDDLSSVGFPEIQTLQPAIQTLGTAWLWDDARSVLFTTDMFCGDTLASEDASVLRRSGEHGMTVKTIRQTVLSKFDWLDSADTTQLEVIWRQTFGTRRPFAIAPIHGRVLVGEALVEETVERYRQAIFAPSATVRVDHAGHRQAAM